MSRKCEHGMMPWECSYCVPSVQIKIVDECIEAVEPKGHNPLTSDFSRGVLRGKEDSVKKLKQVRRKYE